MSFIHVPVYSREEWLSLKKTGIGGSDIPAILGFSRFKDKYDVYMEKVTGQHAEENVNMRAGKALEPVVIAAAKEKAGYQIFTPQPYSPLLHGKAGTHSGDGTLPSMLIRHADYTFAMASIDGYYFHPTTGKLCIFEAKTTKNYSEEDHLGYYYQLQWYMFVTGAESGAIGTMVYRQAFDPDIDSLEDFKYVEYIHRIFDRDEDAISVSLEAAKEFWHEHVEKEQPPPVTKSSSVYSYNKEGNPGEIVLATDKCVASLQRLKILEEQIKSLETEYDEIKASIMQFMGKGEELLYNDIPVVSWKTFSKPYLDTKRLKDERPDINEAYTIISNYRRFLINYKNLNKLTENENERRTSNIRTSFGVHTEASKDIYRPYDRRGVGGA